MRRVGTGGAPPSIRGPPSPAARGVQGQRPLPATTSPAPPGLGQRLRRVTCARAAPGGAPGGCGGGRSPRVAPSPSGARRLPAGGSVPAAPRSLFTGPAALPLVPARAGGGPGDGGDPPFTSSLPPPEARPGVVPSPAGSPRRTRGRGVPPEGWPPGEGRSGMSLGSTWARWWQAGESVSIRAAKS